MGFLLATLIFLYISWGYSRWLFLEVQFRLFMKVICRHEPWRAGTPTARPEGVCGSLGLLVIAPIFSVSSHDSRRILARWLVQVRLASTYCTNTRSLHSIYTRWQRSWLLKVNPHRRMQGMKRPIILICSLSRNRTSCRITRRYSRFNYTTQSESTIKHHPDDWSFASKNYHQVEHVVQPVINELVKWVLFSFNVHSGCKPRNNFEIADHQNSSGDADFTSRFVPFFDPGWSLWDWHCNHRGQEIVPKSTHFSSWFIRWHARSFQSYCEEKGFRKCENTAVGWR